MAEPWWFDERSYQTCISKTISEQRKVGSFSPHSMRLDKILRPKLVKRGRRRGGEGEQEAKAAAEEIKPKQSSAEFLAEAEEPVIPQTLSPSGDHSYYVQIPAQAAACPVILRRSLC